MTITDYSPTAYAAQLQQKITATCAQFSAFNPPNLEVFESPPSQYRMRAEFKIWHHNGGVSYAMFTPGETKKAYIITDFPPASSTINQLMPRLLAQLNEHALLNHKLFQCQFLSTTRGECLITLIYHKPLSDEWQILASQIAAELGCAIIGRARKQKRIINHDWVLETLTVGPRQFDYEHVEASFTQPNAYICQAMLNWAFQHTAPTPQAAQKEQGDLLELYCGNGNFTLPLSLNFNKVLATEIAKSSVDSAKRNMARNGIHNIEFARLSSEEFTQALEGQRTFRRLEHINLNNYNFTTVLVDPPRAGLDDQTLQLIQRFNSIIYISCNPSTLHRNLMALHATHTIEQFALFDQFPFTHHRECGVILKARIT